MPHLIVVMRLTERNREFYLHFDTFENTRVHINCARRIAVIKNNTLSKYIGRALSI